MTQKKRRHFLRLNLFDGAGEGTAGTEAGPPGGEGAESGAAAPDSAAHQTAPQPDGLEEMEQRLPQLRPVLDRLTERTRREQQAALLREERSRQGERIAHRQIARWHSEAEQARAVYPRLNLAAEARDPQFRAMLRAGVPVRHAYEVMHMNDIKAGIARQAAYQREKQVVDHIRAKGNRPRENGTGAHSAFTVGPDVRSMTRQQRDDIAKRVAMGERVVL